MKESEWLSSVSPHEMLNHLAGTTTKRKARLLACACCRRLWPALSERARGLVDLAERFADPSGQANALQTLGRAQHDSGDHAAAAANLEQARALFAKYEDPDGEADTLNNIGRLRLDTAGPAAADQPFTAALHIARRIGTPIHEARALEGLGHGLIRRGHRADGFRHLDEALAIYRRLNSPRSTRLEKIRDQLQATTGRHG